MKKGFRLGLTCLWIVSATLIITHLWLTHPDSVPRFPESFWIWLIEIYGSQNGEELANLELLVTFSISLVLVSVLSFAAWVFWHRFNAVRRNSGLAAYCAEWIKRAKFTN
jgi:hypothetical protein